MNQSMPKMKARTKVYPIMSSTFCRLVKVLQAGPGLRSSTLIGNLVKRYIHPTRILVVILARPSACM